MKRSLLAVLLLLSSSFQAGASGQLAPPFDEARHLAGCPDKLFGLTTTCEQSSSADVAGHFDLSTSIMTRNEGALPAGARSIAEAHFETSYMVPEAVGSVSVSVDVDIEQAAANADGLVLPGASSRPRAYLEVIAYASHAVCSCGGIAVAHVVNDTFAPRAVTDQTLTLDLTVVEEDGGLIDRGVIDVRVSVSAVSFHGETLETGSASAWGRGAITDVRVPEDPS